MMPRRRTKPSTMVGLMPWRLTPVSAARSDGGLDVLGAARLLRVRQHPISVVEAGLPRSGRGFAPPSLPSLRSYLALSVTTLFAPTLSNHAP